MLLPFRFSSKILQFIEDYTDPGVIGILGFLVFLIGALIHAYLNWTKT